MQGIYEQLVACGYTPHVGDNGWWLGPEHELWLLNEQQQLYGPQIQPSPVIQAALEILTRRQQPQLVRRAALTFHAA